MRNDFAAQAHADLALGDEARRIRRRRLGGGSGGHHWMTSSEDLGRVGRLRGAKRSTASRSRGGAQHALGGSAGRPRTARSRRRTRDLDAGLGAQPAGVAADLELVARAGVLARAAPRAIPAARMRPSAMTTRSSQSRSTMSSWWLENSTGTPRAGALARARRARRLDGDRVEARERLVEDEHVGVVHEGGGDLRALLVAERELLDGLVAPLGELEAVEQLVGCGAAHRRRACRAAGRGRRAARASRIFG